MRLDSSSSLLCSLLGLLLTTCVAACGGDDASNSGASSSGTGGSSATTTNSATTSGAGGQSSGATTSGAGGESSGATTSGAGGESSGATTSGAGGAAGVTALSDTFDGASLDPEWQFVNPASVTATLSGGSLELTLIQQALWYQASQGVLLYKLVTGDFKVTSRIHAYRTSDSALPPAGPVELTGLMARSPLSPPENYVFIVVGHDENDLSVETKTTVNSVSTYVGPSWPSAEAELRLCRVGADFVLLKRAVGDSGWSEALTYARPDLPATLQVGPNLYSLGQPDLTVSIDEVTFEAVGGLEDCVID